MHSFPLKTSSILHCLFLNVHTQSLAAYSPPSILLLAAISCLHSSCDLPPWPRPDSRWICWCSVCPGVPSQPLNSFLYWVADLHFICSSSLFHPVAAGQWANVQSAITSEWPPGLNVQLRSALLLQQELHKSIWKISLLVPWGHKKPYLLFPSIYGNLRIWPDFRSTY